MLRQVCLAFKPDHREIWRLLKPLRGSGVLAASGGHTRIACNRRKTQRAPFAALRLCSELSELFQHVTFQTLVFLLILKATISITHAESVSAGNNPIVFLSSVAFCCYLLLAWLQPPPPPNFIVFFLRCRPAALNRFYETKLGERDGDISETANKCDNTLAGMAELLSCGTVWRVKCIVSESRERIMSC